MLWNRKTAAVLSDIWTDAELTPIERIVLLEIEQQWRSGGFGSSIFFHLPPALSLPAPQVARALNGLRQKNRIKFVTHRGERHIEFVQAREYGQ